MKFVNKEEMRKGRRRRNFVQISGFLSSHQCLYLIHLGTKLQDKSEIVIGVSIDKENESNRIVQSLASRNRKPEPFEFTINENGMPEIQEQEVSQAKLTGKKAPKTEKPDYQLSQIITTILIVK